jgi:ATP-dependent DNA helicase RecG
MFSEFLMEGKEPPIIEEIGESVTVTLRKSDLNAAFRFFVQNELEKGNSFDVDRYLILQKLLSQPTIDLEQAAKLSQRSQDSIEVTLRDMESLGYITRGDQKGVVVWRYSEKTRKRLADGLSSESEKAVRESVKATILTELIKCANAGDGGLSNADIREMTGYDRFKVTRMMQDMKREHPEIKTEGKGRSAQFVYAK